MSALSEDPGFAGLPHTVSLSFKYYGIWVHCGGRGTSAHRLSQRRVADDGVLFATKATLAGIRMPWRCCVAALSMLLLQQ